MEIAARARLRPIKDKDLIEAWNNIPPHKDKSDVVREALRLLFFGKTSPSYVARDNFWTDQEKSTSSSEAYTMKENEEDVKDLGIFEQDHEEKLSDLLNSF
ncbi:hypothetical protein ACU1JV_00170 [Paenibacillus sp. T2-29]|uniref:hypothetical protein n=1 Tax=Paenibacillus TaxID=44249 RepID=UPI0039BCBABD